MSSTSVSSLILFIAAMIVAAGVAGTLVTTVTDVTDSVSTQTGNTADTIDTDIEIISDAGSDAVYDEDDEGDGTVTLYVKNTGEKTLASDGTGLDVLVDGEYVSSGDLEIEIHGDDHWRSGAVAELGIDRELETGDEHRAVVTVNGSRAVFEFRT
ncbi:flagellar protein G [Natronococcus sp.]|uniref:flagellar protein G n=1 Tax=Natronococcus sp. TaxID=35747 RepID=UPI003A4DD7A5